MIDPFNIIKKDLITKFATYYNPSSSAFPRVEIYEGTSTLGDDKSRANITQVYLDCITIGHDEFTVNNIASIVRTEIEEGVFNLPGLEFNAAFLISNQYMHESSETEDIHRKLLIYNILTTEI
jgi:hypothetical protein